VGDNFKNNFILLTFFEHAFEYKENHQLEDAVMNHGSAVLLHLFWAVARVFSCVFFYYRPKSKNITNK